MSDIPPDDGDTDQGEEQPSPSAPLMEETAWLAAVIGVAADDWSGISSVARRVPAYEIPSVGPALERIASRLDVAFFNQGFLTNRRLTEVSDDGGSRLIEGSEASVAFRIEDQPVVARLERDNAAEEPRLVTYAATPEVAAAGLHHIAEMIRGEASTWRRRAVLLDPTPAGLIRPVPLPAAPPRPSARAAEELRRSLLDPIAKIREGAEERGCSLLVTGPAGSGKSSLVRWVARELADTTVVIVPPRILTNADLVHLAFEMADDDSPSVVVLEHLDLVLGDRYSMRYPESLAELVAQLDEMLGRSGVFTLATALSPDPLDEVLAARFVRRLKLGAAPRSDRVAILEELVKVHASGDQGLVDALVRRTRQWSHGDLAELGRLAGAEGASGRSVDLLGLVAQVGKVVTCTPSEDGDGTYL